MTSREIRRQFLDFFIQKHGHAFVPSSPVVPLDDPTLLFTNAGMNQFKPYFLGVARPTFPRVANSQKCIRAGGKHNDLDDVGRSRRHHTFFEMLGNWSFGDYFKHQAIAFAWELLTEVWKLDPSRLHVTIYAGNPAENVPADEEAATLWKQVAGLPDDHIHRFRDENFWEMGETGPCGPCTEVFIDRTPDFTGGPLVNGDDPRVMEIWNLVFIQYNRAADRTLSPLPDKHIDTGMGLERICQVLLDKGDNYGTDLFTPLFDAIAGFSGFTYTGQFPATDSASHEQEAANAQLRRDIAFRVIADHARCLTFALTDGAMPGNEGRGYVLRRILRRAVRFGRQHLGLSDPFLYRLTPVVVDHMGEAFPELKSRPGEVAEIIREEEAGFGRTLDRGIELFDQAAAAARADRASAPPRITGADAFKLHDTYGFPIDLTQVMAREKGLSVDVDQYERLMEEAREKARLGGKTRADQSLDLSPAVLAELASLRVQPTDDTLKYEHTSCRATLRAIWNGTRLEQAVETADTRPGEKVALILDHTCFYAEMGGQVGDSGELRTDHGAVFVVEMTQAAGDFVLHLGHVKTGVFRIEDALAASVLGGRERTRRNHTATHLANWALRETLGEHVQQKGSLVDPDKLRFDFVHNKPVADEEIARIEALVNRGISENMTVHSRVSPQEQAMKIHGLRAVFGEKYPPMVRVVSVGPQVEELLADPARENWRQYSVEFCGGTHTHNTSDIGAFAITSEESVSKGVRRIVALTGDAAKDAQSQGEVIAGLLGQADAAPPAELPVLIAALQKAAAAGDAPLLARRQANEAIANLRQKHRQWQKKEQAVSAAGDGGAAADYNTLLSQVRRTGKGNLLVAHMPDGPAETLKAPTDFVRGKFPQGDIAIMLATVASGETDKDGAPLPPKVHLLATVGDPLTQLLRAGDWVKAVAPVVGGAGGGRPQVAMAGGKDPGKVEQALAQALAFAEQRLG